MQNAVATYGYLLDDSTGQPEGGNVLMDNQTGAILAFVMVVLSRKSEQSRYRYQGVLQLQPQNLYWPMVSLLTKV